MAALFEATKFIGGERIYINMDNITMIEKGRENSVVHFVGGGTVAVTDALSELVRVTVQGR